jgi:rod shape-determining protein MreC
MAAGIARLFEQIFVNIHRYEQLLQANEQLLEQLTALQQAHWDAVALMEENADLRAQLGLRERHEMTNELATVVRRGGSNFYSSFVINRGHENALNPFEVGDGVITAYGMLIGRVTAVNATTATVVTVLDSSFSAAVFVGEGGHSVTARGDFELMGSGYFVLDNIPDGTPVNAGDHVVTSGAGDVFPTGLLLGEVVAVYRHQTGLGRFATVRPMLPLESISRVFVITAFDN